MQARLTIPLLLLVALPLALVAWIAGLLWRAEKDRSISAWRASIEQRLAAEQQDLDSGVQAMAGQFAGLLANVKPDVASLTELSVSQPLVRHAFATDAQGQLLVPDVKKPALLAASDREFLQRTEAIWSIGRPLGALTVTEGASDAPIAARGWHVWFFGDGPQWLYWQHSNDGGIVGVEVERAAFLAALLARLDTNGSSSCVRLVASDRTVMHQHGDYLPEAGAAPLMTLACNAPLQHWHWEYLPSPKDAPTVNAVPFVAGVVGVCGLLIGIGALVFTTYRRHMRLAAQRVSFVNQVSHELKTPLTNIRLYNELARDADDARRTKYLDVIDEESSRLGRLIHNVLTFARQERQNLEVHPTKGDLGPLISRMLASWSPVLERKGIRCEMRDDLHAEARFDLDATEQILSNLFSNIEKYATGATLARVRLQAVDGMAEVRVEDDGPGVPEKFEGRIFEAFYRVRRDLTEGVSGTGLGLSIARALAEAQGGELLFERRDKGACFVLRLPYEPTA